MNIRNLYPTLILTLFSSLSFLGCGESTSDKRMTQAFEETREQNPNTSVQIPVRIEEQLEGGSHIVLREENNRRCEAYIECYRCKDDVLMCYCSPYPTGASARHDCRWLGFATYSPSGQKDRIDLILEEGQERQERNDFDKLDALPQNTGAVDPSAGEHSPGREQGSGYSGGSGDGYGGTGTGSYNGYSGSQGGAGTSNPAPGGW